MRPPQGMEWVIILVIILLLFGARRLPDLARSVGRSMKIFKSEVKDTRVGDQDDSAAGTGDDSTPAEPAAGSTGSGATPVTGAPPGAPVPGGGSVVSPGAAAGPHSSTTSGTRSADGDSERHQP